MSWNYRVCTRTLKHPYNDEYYRIFSIYTVYYNDNNEPNSYGTNPRTNGLDDTTNWLANVESVEDLKGNYDLISYAFNKPVLDLDNFPNIYKKPKIKNEKIRTNKKNCLRRKFNRKKNK